MMKKTNKSAFVLHRFTYNFLIFAALIMAMIFTTGCNQGNDDDGTEGDYQLEYVNVGGFNVLKADGNNVQNVLSQYGKQLKNLANSNDFNQLDDNTKNYLQPYLNAIKNNDYSNLEQTITTLYNESEAIFIDLIQSFKLNDNHEHDVVAIDKREALCYNTLILAERSYELGGTSEMNGQMYDGYNYWMQRLVTAMKNRGKDENEVIRDINDYNCTAITAELNHVLPLAVNNLNAEKGLNLTTDYAQKLLISMMNARALHNTAAFAKQASVDLVTPETMISGMASNYYSQSQHQSMGL